MIVRFGIFLLFFLFLTTSALPAEFCRDAFLSEDKQDAWPTSPARSWFARLGAFVDQTVDERYHLSILLPVHKEMDRNNLLRLLTDLSRQIQVLGKLRVIVLVNNTVADRDQKSSAYLDNKKALEVLRKVTTGIDLESLDPSWQKIAASGLKIEVLDRVDDPYNERNIGKVRRDLEDLAITIDDSSWHILQYMDADTGVLDYFAHQVLVKFQNPEVGAVVSHSQFALMENLKGVDLRLALSHQHVASQVSQIRLLEKLRGHFRSSTPRIALRASHVKEGIRCPPMKAGEDVMMMSQIYRNLKVAWQWSAPLFSSDRARPEGFDAADRFRELQQVGDASQLVPNAYKSDVLLREKSEETVQSIISILSKQDRDLSKKISSLFAAEYIYWMIYKSNQRSELLRALAEDPESYFKNYGTNQTEVIKSLESRKGFENSIRMTAVTETLTSILGVLSDLPEIQVDLNKISFMSAVTWMYHRNDFQIDDKQLVEDINDDRIESITRILATSDTSVLEHLPTWLEQYNETHEISGKWFFLFLLRFHKNIFEHVEKGAYTPRQVFHLNEIFAHILKWHSLNQTITPRMISKLENSLLESDSTWAHLLVYLIRSPDTDFEELKMLLPQFP